MTQGVTRPTAWLAEQLEERWEDSIVGRVEDVPVPRFESGERRQARVPKQGLVTVSRGSTNIRPQGVGFVEEGITETASVEIRTDRGDDHLWGVRLSDGTAERYGGMVGEVKRILDSLRRGEGDYDLIEGTEVRDVSELAGPGRFMVVFEVRFTQFARVIWTDKDSESPP